MNYKFLNRMTLGIYFVSAPLAIHSILTGTGIIVNWIVVIFIPWIIYVNWDIIMPIYTEVKDWFCRDGML